MEPTSLQAGGAAPGQGKNFFMEPSVYVTRTKGPKPYYVLHPNNRIRTLLSYQGTALRLRAIGWMGALAPAP